jgi:excisionase family DNA binding protein
MARAMFFTIQEAAKQSRLSVRTLRRAIAARQLRAFYPGGRRKLVIPSDALHAFMYLTTTRASDPVELETASKK